MFLISASAALLGLVGCGAEEAERWVGHGVGFNHRCLLHEGGEISCSGFGEFGQTVPPAGSFVAVESGLHHSCALDAEGQASCWGFDGFGGTQVPPGSYAKIDAGGYQSCGLHTDGTLACWGGIRDGEEDAPAGIHKDVSGGEGHTCAIAQDGVASCWGLDDLGQASPPDIPMESISSGWSHSCGIGLDGQAHCWGEDSNGESSPPSGSFQSIAAGMHNSCGVKESGALTCWGWNEEGLGEPPAGTFQSVSTGGRSACARTVEDQILCWGEDTPNEDPHPDNGQGFTVSGVAWDLGKSSWASPGLCLSAIDPLQFWKDQPLTALSTTKIAEGGAFTLPNVQTSSTVGVLFFLEDCGGIDDIVPTTAGILAAEYQGLQPGAAVGDSFALTFDRAHVAELDQSLEMLGHPGTSIESRGAIFVVITDEWDFVEGATIRCTNGSSCGDVFYTDDDPSDGHFGSGATANAESDGGLDMGVFIVGSPFQEIHIEHPTLSFPTLSMASRPGTITAMRFNAE
jgi:hypothetical protein